MLKSKNVVKKLTTILFTLVAIFGVGLTNVNAETTDITEINLTGNYEYGTVQAGILPAFNPGTTTEGISIGTGNGGWAHFESAISTWSGFGSETPVAYNDGSTKYGFTFYVKTNSGYQLASSFKVFYNGKEVTSTVEVLKYAWGAYVTVDLGKAIGENPATHTVTFVSNGGTEIAPKEVVSGLKINEPSQPTKDKYLFRGWYEEATFNTKFDFYNTPITSDMTLYAKWEAANSINEIRLVGNYQYGNVPEGTLPSFNPRTTTDSITIDNTNSYWVKRTSTTSLWGGFAGNTPVAYNDGKTDYGYTFRVVTNDGYQLDYSNLKIFYNEGEVTSTVEVSKYSWGAYVTVNLGKANGTPVVYTITFNSNDGTSVESQNVNAGEKLTEPTPAPTKEGFTFDGWYEDSTFSKKFDFNTPITDNMTLYAKWIENKYTLTFDANGGTGSMTPKTDLTGEYTLPANGFTAPSGKQFKGWSLTTAGETVTKVDMTENRTVYAIWEDIPVVTYTVTFDVNGGTSVASQNVNAGEKATEPTPAPTKEGFTFDGWYEDATLNTKFDFNTQIVSEITLYAKWIENKYTLTFDANGGTGSMTPKTDLTGEYTLPANGFTAPSGKQFKGWSLTTAGETVTKVDMTENRTVYAIWEDIPVVTYTLTFDANGGSGTMAPITDLTGEYTLPSNGFTAPSGKQFKGWSLTTAGEIVTKVDMTENRTVYAIWEDIPVVTYTLTFDANGGSGTMAPIADLTGEYTLPTNGFTAPSGKQFKGWSLTTDGATVTKVDMTENKTVYAIWEDIPVVTYTLTFDANGGTGSMTPKTGLTGEYTLPANEFTAPSGKEFKGWSLTTDGEIVTKVDMTENRTVYAIWEDIIYSYEFLESTGEQTIDGKANSFKIVIDADDTKFVSLEIDGALYEKDADYTVKHGSTIIEFTSTGLAKLNALSKGEHNVRVTFTDEVINGKITVNAVNLPVNPQNPSMDNPKTYDGIFTYIAILVVSILGLITAVIIGKKRARIN